MKIILGITGSIGAYKAPSVARLLLKKGHKVIPVLTKNALKFVTPLTLTSLLNEKVYYNMFEIEDNKIPIHVKLSREADLIAIVPATFNFITKVSIGIADDLLSLIFHTANVPKIVAPCMHPSLYESEIHTKHLKNLEKMGVYVIEATYGEMSDLTIGKGRLKEPEEIVREIEEIIKIKNKLKDKKIILVFGRTEEEIDTVRVITNKSSGRMGYSLYKILKSMRCSVFAIAGKTDFELPPDIKRVKKSEEMFEILKNEIENKRYDALIMCAAVSDYKPAKKYEKKIKKNKEKLKIEFEKNIDILAEIKKFKNKTKFIGFALEDKFDIKEAYKKIKSKNLDMIILNTVKTMGSEKIEMKIIKKTKEIYEYEEMHKMKAAFEISKKIAEIL